MDKSQRGLVKKAMRGSPKAFGTLIQQEQEYLYRMAFLYVRNEADALDVVQESILKAYKGLRSLREPEYFRTWLTKIAINTAQDLLRKRSSAVPWEETEGLPAPQGLAPEEMCISARCCVGVTLEEGNGPRPVFGSGCHVYLFQHLMGFQERAIGAHFAVVIGVIEQAVQPAALSLIHI